MLHSSPTGARFIVTIHYFSSLILILLFIGSNSLLRVYVCVCVWGGGGMGAQAYITFKKPFQNEGRSEIGL
jgi:hypothetical protein